MKNPFESGDIRVTSPYGMRGDTFHKGIDLVGTSSTRLVAVEDATVAVSAIVTDRANKTWEWGNYIRLDLADGRRLYYCHLARRLVRAGEKVKKGQVIGIMGATGKTTGAHLHWEIRPKGFSTTVDSIVDYSGIPNKIGTYDASSSAPLEEGAAEGTLSAGDTVFLQAGAVYTNGVKVPEKYVGKPYTVLRVQDGKVLIKELYSWVETRYLSAENTAETKEIKAGAKVRLKKGAVYSNDVKVPARYIGKTFTVQSVKEERILILELNSWVKREYVEAE